MTTPEVDSRIRVGGGTGSFGCSQVPLCDLFSLKAVPPNGLCIANVIPAGHTTLGRESRRRRSVRALLTVNDAPGQVSAYYGSAVS